MRMILTALIITNYGDQKGIRMSDILPSPVALKALAGNPSNGPVVMLTLLYATDPRGVPT